MEDQELLNRVKIAAPCDVDWNSMTGDDKIRFCSQCKLNVYNVSAMRTDEAASFIRENEGRRVCLQLYRRRDGTIITDNCPVGLRRLRDAGRAVVAAAFSIFACLCLPLWASAQEAIHNGQKHSEPGSRHNKRGTSNLQELGEHEPISEKERADRARRQALRLNAERWTNIKMGQAAPNEPGGHDVIQDKESQGPGRIMHGPGPVQAWPVYLPDSSKKEAKPQPQIEEAYSAYLRTEEGKIGLTVATLLTSAVSISVLWRKKKVSVWALGGVSTIILLVAGFVWGLTR